MCSSDLVPALAQNPALTAMSEKPGTGVLFERVVHQSAGDLSSPLIAPSSSHQLNRFNFEAWLLGRAGLDPARLTNHGRLAAQFFFDGFFPFVVLILVSLLTKPTDSSRVALFYGKMKTPVGATPELEAAAMEETRVNPARFDQTKLVPGSNWEFCKWDRVDTIGFIVCCALTAVIILVFIGALKLAAAA